MPRRRDSERLVRAVGWRVRELRLARQLTQEALAERLEVATPHVQAIERGIRNLTLVTLSKLADALDVEPIQLLVPPRSETRTGTPGRPTKANRDARGPVPVAIYQSDEAALGTLARRKPSRRSTPART